MTKRLLTALIAVAALLTGVVAVTAPAQAAQTVSASVQNGPGACYDDPNLPTDVSGCKFYTGKTLCVDGSGINGAYYRVGVIAQAWNNAVDWADKFALDYSDDCVADGYPPSRRMVVDGYYGDANDGICMIGTNMATTYGGENFKWWTSGPAVYIDFNSTCVQGQANRDKAVSIAIGRLVGLQDLTSSGWASRVMYTGSGAVTMPDAGSGLTLRKIYGGTWGQ